MNPVTVDDCPFCGIVWRGEPATVLRRTDEVWVIRPLRPVTDGHVLAIPVTHVPDAPSAPALAGRTLEVAARYASEEVGPVNLITSAGRPATQTVMHLHVHVVPRRSGDGLRLPWSPADSRPQVAAPRAPQLPTWMDPTPLDKASLREATVAHAREYPCGGSPSLRWTFAGQPPGGHTPPLERAELDVWCPRHGQLRHVRDVDLSKVRR